VTAPRDISAFIECWNDVFHHLDEGVLVLDRERSIVLANAQARRLLGYEDGQKLGGRCRNATRGLDCEKACPLTFALDRGTESVRDFDTVYHRADGQPVPLRITVVPLRDDEGSFSGAVEILRPRHPDPGFVLAGHSARATELRSRLELVARSRRPVTIVGDRTATEDVARALHRHCGLQPRTFHRWSGSWDDVPSFPPGTMYVRCEGVDDFMAAPIPSGWRVVCQSTDGRDAFEDGERIELPLPRDMGSDLVDVVVAWIRTLRPALDVTPEAVSQLAERVHEDGFDGAARAIRTAVASANGRLDVAHVLDAVGSVCLFDEILSQPEPLVAMERRLVNEALVACDWRMQEAADVLGVSRVTLWRKVKDLGIERPEPGDG
jgi:PAS domain S-box-containing protein